MNVKSFLYRYDIWFISLFALCVRVVGLQWMDYTNFPEFYRDFVMTSKITHGVLVWLGPPSMLGGFHFPPFYYYSMAPLLWIFHGHPAGLIATGIVVSTLTVVVLFWLLLLWTGNRNAARLGALFCSLSVYSLHLASYTSNPNFLPLFVLWFFYHLTKVLQNGASRFDYIGLGLSFALATQLHTTALVVLPVVVVIACIVLRVRVRFMHALLAGVVALALYAPYLVFDAVHGFSNFRRLFVLGAQNLHGGNFISSVRALWNFFEGTLTPFNAWYNYTYIEPNSLYVVVAGVVVMLLVRVLYKYVRGCHTLGKGTMQLFSREARVLLWAWFIVEMLVILLYSRAAHDHYLIILWPWPLIALTWAVWWLGERFGVFRLAAVTVLVVMSLQVYSFYRRAHVPWSYFFTVYESTYKNMPNISEIGASWK